jgi:hypothetical protein
LFPATLRGRQRKRPAEVAMIYRQQQMVDGAGVARPLQTIEILFGSDHDDRNVGAALDAVQLMDQPGCLALGDCGGEHDEAGTILTAERQRRVGIAEGLRDGPAAERIDKPFEDLQVGGAVIDDDDRLGRHRRTPRAAALLAILGKLD